jgi:Carboxypeptidase regulatory-like domain
MKRAFGLRIIFSRTRRPILVRPFLSPRVPFASARPRPTHLAATSLDSLRRRHADAPPHAHLSQDDGRFRLLRNCSSSPAVHPSRVSMRPSSVGRRGKVVKGHCIALMFVACCAMVSGRTEAAQETINYSSLGGRITDSQKAFVPGATVIARQSDTNVASETTTDSEGRFRFPSLKVGPYELKVHLAGFADTVRTLRLTLGGAFDVPISLYVAGLDTAVMVTLVAFSRLSGSTTADFRHGEQCSYTRQLC